MKAHLIMAAVALVFMSAVSWAQGFGGRYTPGSIGEDAFSRGRSATAEADQLFAEGEIEEAQTIYLEAEGHFREALRIEPTWSQALEWLGYVLYAQGRSEEVVTLGREALEYGGRQLGIRRILGVALLDLGEDDEAIELLEEVEEAGGATAEVLFLLGRYYYQDGEYDRAGDLFERYLVMANTDASVHGTLGNVYLRTRQYDRALTEFNAVLEMEPENLAARINIGDVYYVSGQYTRAIDVYQSVIQEATANYRVVYNLGRSYLETGRYEDSLRTFYAFRQLRPELEHGDYFIGRSLYELGRFDESFEAFQQVFRVAPSHPLTVYRLGEVEWQRGNIESAIGYLRTSRESGVTGAWLSWPVNVNADVLVNRDAPLMWLEVDGDVLWHHVLSDREVMQYGEEPPDLLAIDGDLYITSSHRILAVDLVDGTLQLQHEFGAAPANPMQIDDGQYVVTGPGEQCAGPIASLQFTVLCGSWLVSANGGVLAIFDTDSGDILGELSLTEGDDVGAEEDPTTFAAFSIQDVKVRLSGTTELPDL